MHYDKEYKVNLEVNGDDDDNRDKDAGAQHFVAARQSLQLAGYKQYVAVGVATCNQSQEMEFDVHSSWQRQGWPAMGFSVLDALTLCCLGNVLPILPPAI